MHTGEYYVYEYLRERKGKHGDAGTPYYIGKGKGGRAYHHSHSVHLPPDRSNIVKLLEDVSEQDALREEIRLIRKHGRVDLGTGCLLNRIDGGEGSSGTIRTPETRRKIGDGNKGKVRSPELRQFWSNQRKNRPLSMKTRENMSLVRRGRKHSWGAAISKANAGKPLSEAHLQALAEARLRRRGQKRTEEAKKKTSETLRARNPYPSAWALYLRQYRNRK